VPLIYISAIVKNLSQNNIMGHIDLRFEKKKKKKGHIYKNPIENKDIYIYKKVLNEMVRLLEVSCKLHHSLPAWRIADKINTRGDGRWTNYSCCWI
jgi:cephalosporin-C deacetylase-like acetyl esterase